MPALGATSEARKISFDYVGSTDRLLDLPLEAKSDARQLRIVALPEIARSLFVVDDGVPQRIADSWLAEVLTELAEADLEAEEEGYPEPGYVAKAQAERILRQLAVTDPAGSSPAVTPTADGDIAISFHSPEIEGIVQIVCEQGGSAAVYSTIGGKSRYTCYDAASACDLPDATLKVELAKLKPA